MAYTPLSVTPDCRSSAQSLKVSRFPWGRLEISGIKRHLFTDGIVMGCTHIPYSGPGLGYNIQRVWIKCKLGDISTSDKLISDNMLI